MTLGEDVERTNIDAHETAIIAITRLSWHFLSELIDDNADEIMAKNK
ncbi:MAG: hypothetical protein ACTSW1_11375 [Candidatus Hodarchaeales archaeon]